MSGQIGKDASTGLLVPGGVVEESEKVKCTGVCYNNIITKCVCNMFKYLSFSLGRK